MGFFSSSDFSLFMIFGISDLCDVLLFWPSFVNAVGSDKSGINIPGPDDVAQHKTGPSNDGEFGIRPVRSETPIMFDWGIVVSTRHSTHDDCFSLISPFLWTSSSQLRDTQFMPLTHVRKGDIFTPKILLFLHQFFSDQYFCIRFTQGIVSITGGVYLNDRVLGNCRPAIFNFVVVQFFRKKLAVVQLYTPPCNCDLKSSENNRKNSVIYWWAYRTPRTYHTVTIFWDINYKNSNNDSCWSKRNIWFCTFHLVIYL